VTHGGFGYDSGERGFATVMTGRHRPTALFCVGDLVAVGAINQAQRMDIAVPDDVAIVGFDDIDMAGWPRFDLTTARIDLSGMAVAAADLLVRRLGGDAGPAGTQVFPAELVLRGTHGR
jgi:LacI family transcriptional regulator